MFGFLKNKKNTGVYAPLDGELIDLTKVDDKVFASKMMGDGFAIKPDNDKKYEVIKAPVNGKIVSLPKTGHAVGIHTKEGTDVLIHVGIDTVDLKGKGFKLLKKEGEFVSEGDKIIRFDPKVIAKANLDDTVMVIFTAGYDKAINLEDKYCSKIKSGEKVLE